MGERPVARPGARRPARSPSPWRAGLVRVQAGWLALQAALGVLLWVLGFTNDTFRSWLELVPERPEVSTAFVAGDLGLIVVGSALGAWGLWRERPWTVAVVAFTFGAVAYPTTYLVWWVATEQTGETGLLVMVAACTLTGWTAVSAYRDDRDRRAG